jgi:RNA polymerase sigma-70 factor, ECF subfamily
MIDSKSNEKERLKVVYEKYNRQIFSIAFHISGSQQEAEDIVQSVFIKFAKKINSIDGEPKYWLIRVATNLCFDKKRAFKRVLAFNQELRDFHNQDVLLQDEKIELSNKVKQILTRLKPKEKKIIVLKYMEEMSYEEISKLLNIPIGSLKSISSRAIARLRKESLI